MKLTLILPGVIWPDADPLFFRDLSLPTLSWMLGKADRLPNTRGTVDEWLQQRLGLTTPVSAAHAAAQLTEAAEINGGSWLLAHPVHLVPNRSELRIADAQQLGITVQESNALIAALNQHFAEDDLRFFALSADEWLLHSQTDVNASFTPYEQAVGASMDPLLPEGEDALDWHRWMNEMQMLMYSHAVNDARDAKGQPMIHGIWFSNPGAITSETISPVPTAQLWVDSSMWQGIAKQVGIHYQAAPSRSESILEQAKDGWIRLDNARWPQIRQDVWNWQEALRELEDVWLAPLQAALLAGQLTELTLVLPATDEVQQYQLTPAAKWKFWRRPAALTVLG